MSKGMSYFIHDSDAADRDTLSILRGLYGNDGYAFWFITLECLVQNDEMKIDCSKRKDWLRYVAKCGVSETTATSILEVLSVLGAIDSDLWKKKHIIWSDALVERLKTRLTRRVDGVPEKPDMDNASEKKPDKKAQKPPDKVKYAEYVSMKAEDYNKLCGKYGKQAADKFIETLDNYKGSTGKKYKDDYRAILNWVVDRTFEKYPELAMQASGGSDPFGNVQVPEDYKV